MSFSFKRSIFFSLAILYGLNLYSKPAKPGLFTIEQPDGEEISISVTGDFRSHQYFSSDGYLILRDADNYFVYADLDNEGNVIPSPVRVSNPEKRAEESNKRLSQINSERVIRTATYIRKQQDAGIGIWDTGFPTIGRQKSIIILVDFPDCKFTISKPYEYFYDMLNLEGFSEYKSTGSARDYYIKNSDGKFIPEFDVYGPVTMPESYEYYGKNDEENVYMMVIEACRQLDGKVDFSEYDRNKDGNVDNVYIFYAGYGEADAHKESLIWPHSWDISMAAPDEEFYFDGVRLTNYACSNELQYNKNGSIVPDGIGTFCHEFNHILGLPDLYSTNYSSSFTPGEWTIMDTGSYNNDSRTPPLMSSFELQALDWLTPSPLIKEGNYILKPISQSKDAYILQTDDENEFYLFEYRDNSSFDASLPGHGMLVWHIDFDYETWDENEVNNISTHQRVDLIEADNILTYSTRAGDAFPGTANVRDFTFFTTPRLATWDGNPLKLNISAITENYPDYLSFRASSDPATEIKAIEQTSVISISGNVIECNAPTDIYDVSGRKIAANLTGKKEFSRGTYIAKSGNEIIKFILK